MSFRDMVLQDNEDVFCNVEEFGDPRTIVYDGVEYKDVPCVLSKLKEKDRQPHAKDHAQGIYEVTATVHFPAEKLGGFVPEKGCKISISDDDDFLRQYYVAQSGNDHGMVRLELEAYDE